MEDIIYFDNSATTKPCETAVRYINDCLTGEWGNPSSLHRLGLTAEIAMNRARACIARSLKCREDEIFFTGSGTEANNTAIFSAAKLRKARGNRIVTTTTEHPSVLEAVKLLENDGFEVVRLRPEKNGSISPDDVENALNANTVLVSVMLVNNETGAINQIAEISKLVKKLSPYAIFHTDAVQGYGKMKIDAAKLGADLLSASGHKIHAAKGVGFLYIKKGLSLPPRMVGGGQERGFRSGTEPVPLICGLHGAVKELPDPDRQMAIQKELYDYAKQHLLDTGFVDINSPEDGLPYILNISVSGYRSETLLHFLESRDIFVSSGSACAKGHGSYVLREMGLNTRRTDSALRLSFSRYNTKEEIDRLCNALSDAVRQLRKS